jgi:pimeloyl-ACP methyl ester carboxylesterase
MSFVHVAGLARYADLTEELQELKERELPIIVLWGRRDRIVTRQSFEQMCQLAGSVQSITVEGGHAWLIVDANTFGEVMTNVLDIVSKVHPPKRRLLSRWRRSGPRRSVAGID